jgi:hypothetical protein
MGFKITGGTAGSLTELVDQMANEMEQKTGVPRAQWDVVEEPATDPDFASLADPRTQAALLGAVEKDGRVTRHSLIARVAHMPQLAACIPRFLQYGRARGWLRVIEQNEQGDVFEIAEAGQAHIAANGPIELPPGSTEITP